MLATTATKGCTSAVGSTSYVMSMISRSCIPTMTSCSLGPRMSKTSMSKQWLGQGRTPIPVSLHANRTVFACASTTSQEQQLWKLCQPYAHTTAPQHTLCQRVEQFLPELFVFVAVPGVPAHNNLAQRSVRPLVIARKISGGTRSPKGSETRMGLASLFGTWMAQGLNPFHQCLALLTTKTSLG